MEVLAYISLFYTAVWLFVEKLPKLIEYIYRKITK